MNDAIEDLEFNASSNFEDDDYDDDSDIEKGLEFDLADAEIDDDNFDVYDFLKGLADTNNANTDRLSRAVESLLKVNLTQSRLIKGLSDRIEALEMRPGKRSAKPVLSKGQAEGIVERPFEDNLSDIFGAAEEVSNGSIIGPVKDRICSEMRKGIDDNSFSRDEVLNFSQVPFDTTIEAIKKAFPNTAPIIDKYIDAE